MHLSVNQAGGEALKYKEDFSMARERFHAFWEHEIINRVCLAVTAPRENPVPLPEPVNDEQYLTDPEYVVRLVNAQMSNTYFGGESLPATWAPGNLLYPSYGGNGKIAISTVWVEPTMDTWEEWADYQFDPQNKWIQHTLRVTRALAEDAPGKYLVGSPGVFGAMDAMSMIRGMQEFVMDLVLEERADAVRTAHLRCIEGFKFIVNAIYEAAKYNGGDAVNHPGILAPARINNWSADFSCLIGPQTFRKWLIPEMEEMARLFEFSMYHLDGPDAARHLPMILEIGELRGIQYERGFGHTVAEALPVYKQIQQAGKVQFLGVGYNEVEWVLGELDPRGLLLFTTAPNIESADALLKNAERWSAKM